MRCRSCPRMPLVSLRPQVPESAERTARRTSAECGSFAEFRHIRRIVAGGGIHSDFPRSRPTRMEMIPHQTSGSRARTSAPCSHHLGENSTSACSNCVSKLRGSVLGSAGSFELRASVARHRDSAFPSSLSRVAAPVRSRHFSCSFVRSRCCLLMATCMSWAAGIALSPFRCAVRSADLLPLSELASLANHLLAPTSLMSFAVRSLSACPTLLTSTGGSLVCSALLLLVEPMPYRC